MYNGSVYGNYRTRSFSDIFDSANELLDFYTTNGAFPVNLTDNSIKTIWGLLYSRYGNSHIKSSDENRFKYQLISIIFQYGPTWEKRLEIQQTLRNLNENEIRAGSYTTVSSGANPGSILTDEQLENAGANAYSRQKTKRSAVDAYAMLYNMLEQDVTEEFVLRFQPLFRQVALPDAPLWYEDPNIE